MSEQLTLDLSQNEKNALTAYADAERAKLIPIMPQEINIHL